MPTLTDEKLKEVQEFLARGDKMQAIKAWREAAGCGLAEAKQAVDEEHARLMRDQPEKFKAATSGCFGLVLLVVGAGVAWAALT